MPWQSRLPHPRRPSLGKSLIYLGWLLFILGVAYLAVQPFYATWAVWRMFFGDGQAPGTEAMILGAGCIVSFVIVVVANGCIKKGRRFAAARLEDLLDRDGRPPVLFLRSFADDKVAVGIRGFSGPVTLEEAIVPLLNRIGPVIAIGKPGESIAPLGAAREYLSNDAWKGAVVRWIDRARLIVMVMGPLSDQQGLAWEMSQLRDRGRLSKVILIMPPGDIAAAAWRWEEYREFFGGGFPPFEGGEILVTFDSESKARPVRVAPQMIDPHYLVGGSYEYEKIYIASLARLFDDVGLTTVV